MLKRIIILALILIAPSLNARRRKKIIQKFDYPQPMLVQNETKPEIKPTTPQPKVKKPQAKPEIKPKKATVKTPEATTPPTPTQNKESKPPEPPEKPEKDIYLNFENADLKTFVDYIGEIKKINVVTDPKIAGNKISLTIRDPLTVDGAWNIFLTILEMAQFSIIKVGDLHKIIPQATKLREPLPTYINIPSEKLPDSDLTIRFVTMLNNIPIKQVRGLLQSMLSPRSQIINNDNINGFVITDKSYNIKSAMQVIQELDRSDIKQSVTVMKLKEANAEDVRDLFKSLMQTPRQSPLARLLGRGPESSLSYFPPTTKIIAERRTNSLILLGDQKSIKRIEDFVTEHVDTKLKGVKSPIHLYELQHTDVDQIKDILEAVTESNASSPAAQYGGIRGGVKYFKKMQFSMDKENNRLIVSSTDDQDWKLLKKTLVDLDKPQPQVALETLVVSVDFNNNKELGAQIRNKKHGQLGNNMNAQAAHLTDVVLDEQTIDGKKAYSVLGDLLQKMTFGLGSTVLTFGRITDVWAMIKLLKSQTNTSVLYQPFIVAKNMRKATVKVGEVRRLPYQETISDLTGDIGDGQGYEDVPASIQIDVTPQINLDGVINLDINVDLTEFSGGTTDRPDKSVQKLNTKVSVANGQVLVLGGFVKTKVTENEYKTPWLNKVPVLGWLFKSKSRRVEKKYIFIFMSPTILKPRTRPGTGLYTKMKLQRAKSDIDDAVEVKKGIDPIHNWFFNPEGETYSHKITDFANARYQPTSVDIINDPYYRATPLKEEKKKEAEKTENNTKTTMRKLQREKLKTLFAKRAGEA
jgi:general secretion pathway protein D